MGVRIDMYAVDIPLFESFLDQSVADALWLYYEDVDSSEKQTLRFYIGDESDYMAIMSSLATVFFYGAITKRKQ